MKNRKQRVVIQGQTSSSGIVQAGVPQVSVFGPLLFLIFINDIVDLVCSNIKLFADDTSLYLDVDDPVIIDVCINYDISTISKIGQTTGL